ncbi:Usherin Usher syndrome type IIa protein -like protein [Triplophysa tibetana]|uniref:Usherin Usher syndrome type IIa protein-like protein n=1 Tax=Triplophysa tibetana TaxID=1572043 RepID=A0A5A9NF44_9TELE|nr:Usherin Usher syndrome type IIa protein -like protein [Triplophysa tibetana]
MAGVGLLLFALILAVILHKTLNKSAFTRERPPLVPLPLHRQTPLTKYPPSNSYLEVIEEKVMKEDVSPEGETGLVTVSGLYTQNLLQRSVSQLMDSNDQDPWEPHFRRLDSGLFEGEEFVDSIKGFSTVRKEHTMFTDTNL